jgi:hypothetical protein
MLGTIGSIQNLLDTQALVQQGLQRHQQALDRQRLQFQRSVRDPRVLAALLRLVDPNYGVLTPERLNILLAALKIPSNQVNLNSAFFAINGGRIEIRDSATQEVIACEYLSSFYFYLLTQVTSVSSCRGLRFIKTSIY